MKQAIPFSRKSLGQHFLVNLHSRQKIIEACNLRDTDSVLEIGSGPGQLTEEIARRAKEVLAVELDKRFCELLRQQSLPNVRVICQDILKFDFKSLKTKVKVIGNLPYYISTPIIARLLENQEKIDSIYIALQKELAERIVALPGGKEYGAFSCFVQYFTEPRILFKISKGCFRPQPKVDSVFLELKVRKKPVVEVKDETLFFKIIHAAFSQRRKTIQNSLSGIFPKVGLITILEKARLDHRSRPEQLSLEDFSKIYQFISEK